MLLHGEKCQPRDNEQDQHNPPQPGRARLHHSHESYSARNRVEPGQTGKQQQPVLLMSIGVDVRDGKYLALKRVILRVSVKPHRSSSLQRQHDVIPYWMVSNTLASDVSEIGVNCWCHVDC